MRFTEKKKICTIIAKKGHLHFSTVNCLNYLKKYTLQNIFFIYLGNWGLSSGFSPLIFSDILMNFVWKGTPGHGGDKTNQSILRFNETNTIAGTRVQLQKFRSVTCKNNHSPVEKKME